MNLLTGLFTYFIVFALLVEITVGAKKEKKRYSTKATTTTKPTPKKHNFCWVSPWGWITAGTNVTVHNCRQAACTLEKGLIYKSCEKKFKQCNVKKYPIPEEHIYKYGFPKCCPLHDCEESSFENDYTGM